MGILHWSTLGVGECDVRLEALSYIGMWARGGSWGCPPVPEKCEILWSKCLWFWSTTLNKIITQKRGTRQWLPFLVGRNVQIPTFKHQIKVGHQVILLVNEKFCKTCQLHSCNFQECVGILNFNSYTFWHFFWARRSQPPRSEGVCLPMLSYPVSLFL